MFFFRLYIIKGSAKYTLMVKRLKSILDAWYKKNYILEVIDVLEQADQAADDKIFATPTLVRLSPPPLKKVVGDLNNKKKLETFLAT
jgi:circadian clock protein KaiB